MKKVIFVTFVIIILNPLIAGAVPNALQKQEYLFPFAWWDLNAHSELQVSIV